MFVFVFEWLSIFVFDNVVFVVIVVVSVDDIELNKLISFVDKFVVFFVELSRISYKKYNEVIL